MTYSNGLKSVVSDYGTERTTDYSAPQQKIGDFTQSKLSGWSA